MPKKNNAKKSLRFDTVQEFRFNRIQSFVTMPSYGGYSLGMGKYFKSFLIWFNYRNDSGKMHYNGRELSLDKYRAEREQSRRRKVRRWRKRQQQVRITISNRQ